MNSSNSNLLNRLILLVLCLNLVCLVLLVARVYRQPGERSVQSTPLEQNAPTPTDDSRASGATGNRFERKLGADPRPAQTQTASKSGDGRTRPVTSRPEPAEWIPQQPALPAPAPAPVFPAPLVEQGTLVNLPSPSEVGAPLAAPGTGASFLFGRVLLNGVPPPEVPIKMGPACGEAAGRLVTTRHYVVGRDRGLADVLVWLKNVPPAPALLPSTVLKEVGCMFEPYVLGVVTGQKFTIRNLDPVLHNVHATPKNNREFNFAQPTAGATATRSFGTAELFIPIKCDVHWWEFAYVNVLEHPYFSITDTNGFFQIPQGAPPGRYVVGAKHLKAGELEQEVELKAGEEQSLTFEFVPAKIQAKGK